MKAPFSLVATSIRCHPRQVPNEWIEQVLKPQLADVAKLDWKAESLGEFMVGIHEQIKRVASEGKLSDDEVAEARALVHEANLSIPGVTVVSRRATISTGGHAVARRRRNVE